MSDTYPAIPLGEVLRLDLDKVSIDPSITYDMVGVYSFGRGLFHREPVHGGNTSYKFFYRLKADHIVMSQLFGWEGALATSSDEFAGSFVSPQFPTFLCDLQRLDQGFLGWLMRMPSFWEDLATRTKGMGDRRRTLNPEALFKCAIPLPPLAEQRRIVARIEALAGKITEARGLRRHAAEERDLLSRSARNEIFNTLRSTIAPVRLDTIGQSRLGKMLSQDAKRGLVGVPYLRNANVQWDRLDLSSVYEMDFSEAERKEFALQKGDILVCEGGNIGMAAIWNDEIPGCCYQKALHRVRVDTSKAIPRFLLQHIIWAAEQGHFARIKTQTTIAHLTGVMLKSYGVLVPSLSEQRRIVAYLDGLQTNIDALKRLQAETAAELDALLPSVLDRAFRGEL